MMYDIKTTPDRDLFLAGGSVACGVPLYSFQNSLLAGTKYQNIRNSKKVKYVNETESVFPPGVCSCHLAKTPSFSLCCERGIYALAGAMIKRAFPPL